MASTTNDEGGSPVGAMERLNMIKVWTHVTQFALTLLTICVVAPVIATEIKYYGGSQASPNWTLVVAVISWWVPVLLVYFPWAYERKRKNKFRRIGKFCMKPRTNLIFTAFNSVIWATAAIAMTVHANDASNCNLDSGLEESDDSYASAWTQQCNCAKAAAAFTWITCFSWLVTLVCSVIFFWHEKQLVQKNLKEHEMNKQATAQQMHPTEAEYQFGSASAAAAAVAGSGDEEQATAQQPLYVDRRTPSPPIAQKTEIPSEESPTPMQQNTYYHHSPTPPIHAVTGPSTYMPPHPHPEPQPYIHAITTASPPPPLYPPHHLQQQQHQQHVAAAPGPMYHMPQPSYYTTQ